MTPGVSNISTPLSDLDKVESRSLRHRPSNGIRPWRSACILTP